jgi:hypothetical protein
VVDGESGPGEAAATEREGDAGHNRRTTLHQDCRQGHEARLAHVRPAGEQFADL